MEQVQQDITVVFDNLYKDVVVFKNAIGYQLGSGFVGVQGSDGALTIYPQTRVFEITVTPKD